MAEWKYKVPIVTAAWKGNEHEVRRILYRGYETTYVNIERNLPIALAAAGGHHGCVDTLIGHPEVEPADRNNNALYHAVRIGHEGIVESLLDVRSVTMGLDYNGSDDMISAAAGGGHCSILKRLISKYNIRNADPSEGVPPAAHWNETATLQILLADKRTNPSIHGNWAMERAVRKESWEAVQLLLDHERLEITEEYRKEVNKIMKGAKEKKETIRKENELISLEKSNWFL